MARKKERAVITVTGVDHPGIVAAVTTELAKLNVNIEDISQTILQDFFTMIMLVDVRGVKRNEIQKALDKVADKQKVKIIMQHEDLFRYMHRV
ncbi:MAG: ACT domain-containing protein [Hadesarchaea archaeon]|nr:ACT domain-containing protein [Hadesarchaea archaeon]MDH5686216.1 ACT domain-containing protein [Hadesarchaea archaeon]